MIEYHDVDRLQVVDAGPATIPFSVQAFRTFNIQPKTDQVVFATIDAGASETGMLFGILRQAKSDERGDGFDRMIEYLEPQRRAVARRRAPAPPARLPRLRAPTKSADARRPRSPSSAPHEEPAPADARARSRSSAPPRPAPTCRS